MKKLTYEKGYKDGRKEYMIKLEEHINGHTKDYEKECTICQLLKKYANGLNSNEVKKE